MKHFLNQLWCVVRGILAELTDQSAYHRYLAAHHLEPSGPAWRAFQDEHWQSKSRRGRCC
jgi:hypothetical protein